MFELRFENEREIPFELGYARSRFEIAGCDGKIAGAIALILCGFREALFISFARGLNEHIGEASETVVKRFCDKAEKKREDEEVGNIQKSNFGAVKAADPES